MTRHSDAIPVKAGTAELMACLTLVAPSGMTAEDRNAWVRVARETLRGIPGDLLQRGCRKARETCRFASEIVPTILGTVKADWDFRIRHARPEVLALPPAPRPPVPREITQQILRDVREQMQKERGE